MKYRSLWTFCAICLSLLGCGRTAVLVPVVETGSEAPAVSVSVGESGEPFQFAADGAGTLLSKALAPAEGQRLLNALSRELPAFPAPRNLESPYLPLHAGQALLPSIPTLAVARELKPRLVTDETVFNPREELSLPQAISFPVPDRARLAAVDVNRPPPLPRLASPSPDRVSLDDPTGPVSAEAAVAAPLPVRVRPVPFAKLRVPDPYENRATARLPLALPETAHPTTSATPRVPSK